MRRLMCCVAALSVLWAGNAVAHEADAQQREWEPNGGEASLDAKQTIRELVEAYPASTAISQRLDKLHQDEAALVEQLETLLDELGPVPPRPPDPSGVIEVLRDGKTAAIRYAPEEKVSVLVDPSQPIGRAIYTFLQDRAMKELYGMVVRKLVRGLCSDNRPTLLEWFSHTCRLADIEPGSPPPRPELLQQAAQEDLRVLPLHLATWFARNERTLEACALRVAWYASTELTPVHADFTPRAVAVVLDGLRTPLCKSHVQIPDKVHAVASAVAAIAYTQQHQVSPLKLRSVLVHDYTLALMPSRNPKLLVVRDRVNRYVRDIDKYLSAWKQQPESNQRTRALKDWRENRERVSLVLGSLGGEPDLSSLRIEAQRDIHELVDAEFGTPEYVSLIKAISNLPITGRALEGMTAKRDSRADVLLAIAPLLSAVFIERLKDSGQRALWRNAFTIYESILVGDYSRTIAALAEFRELGDKTWGQDFFKVAAVLASIAEAKTQEELLAVLDRESLPTGSWAYKRYNSTWSITGYFGVASHAERVNADNDWGATFGVFGPIGVEGTRAFVRDETSYGSLSLMAQFIDVGSLSNARPFDQDATAQAEPATGFVQLLAPGLRASYGFPNAPLVLSANVDLVPALRPVEATNGLRNRSVTRVGLAIGVDIPLIFFGSK